MAALILSTDKTQLTQFSGNKVAYPVYLTLGNLPSRLRRKPSEQACVLIGYLPVEKVVKDGLSKRDVSSRYQRLFHAAMGHIVEPLKAAGKNGVELVGGDGVVRRVHPILVSYVADYPEQCLVACAKYGTCPKCFVSAKDLGNPEPSRARTRAETLKVMSDARAKTTTSASYFKSCMEHDVSGYVLKPFWTDLPYTDIHVCVTPDVLHQLYQGVLKHVIGWSQEVVGEQELDRRIRRLPRALGLRHFKGGIAALSQVSGSERKDMGKVLLGCLVGSRMTDQGITACRSILDFIYLAQYKSHTDVTLGYMSDALETWHKNKAFFIKAGVRKHLHIPKFHSMPHYMPSIRLLGTTDNFNTEMFERLHIDFSKKGWRASNKRDAMPQMTSWVVRQENIVAFGRYIEWAQRTAPPAGMYFHCPKKGFPANIIRKHQRSTRCSPSLLAWTLPPRSLYSCLKPFLFPAIPLRLRSPCNPLRGSIAFPTSSRTSFTTLTSSLFRPIHRLFAPSPLHSRSTALTPSTHSSSAARALRKTHRPTKIPFAPPHLIMAALTPSLCLQMTRRRAHLLMVCLFAAI